jgi:hypothetical protein
LTALIIADSKPNGTVHLDPEVEIIIISFCKTKNLIDVSGLHCGYYQAIFFWVFTPCSRVG